MDYYQIIKRPLITEKGMLSSEAHNTVVFEVDRRANKMQIKQAVESLFQVKVMRVNTLNMQGKKRRMGRHSGKRPDWKKAIVTLAPGERIEFFDGV